MELDAEEERAEGVADAHAFATRCLASAASALIWARTTSRSRDEPDGPEIVVAGAAPPVEIPLSDMTDTRTLKTSESSASSRRCSKLQHALTPPERGCDTAGICSAGAAGAAGTAEAPALLLASQRSIFPSDFELEAAGAGAAAGAGVSDFWPARASHLSSFP